MIHCGFLNSLPREKNELVRFRPAPKSVSNLSPNISNVDMMAQPTEVFTQLYSDASRKLYHFLQPLKPGTDADDIEQ